MRILILVLCFLLAGCAPARAALDAQSEGNPAGGHNESSAGGSCQETPAVRLTPPKDAAVLDEPAEDNYIANADESILVGAYWTEKEDYRLKAGQEGNKVGWFRPAGAALDVTGRRIDGKASPLEFEAPCCYPTRFQASGLYFPTGGCWEVTAKAEESELTFVVYVVEP